VKTFLFGDFELIGPKRLLLKQGKPVALNSKTFDVLLTLVERPGQVLSRGELLDKVWPEQFVEENNLAVQISALRKVFGETKSEHQYIVTVPGKGYSFVAELNKPAESEIILETYKFERIIEQETVDDGFSQAIDLSTQPHSVRQGTQFLSSQVNLSTRRVFVALSVLVLTLSGLGYWFFFFEPQTTQPSNQSP
ncbi:MAG: transcriptional regulator, partial [Pyrinomonadaceae bacterium]